MKTFKDGKGREWTINLTLGTAKRVYDKMFVDLLNPIGNDPTNYVAVRLIREDLFLCEVVAELIGAELESKKVSKEDFLDSIDGQTVSVISDAFFEEYNSFFTARKKDFVIKIINADKKAIDEAAERVVADIKSRKLLGGESIELQDELGLQTGEN